MYNSDSPHLYSCAYPQARIKNVGLKRGSNKTYLHAGRVGVPGEAAPTVNQTIEIVSVLSVKSAI